MRCETGLVPVGQYLAQCFLLGADPFAAAYIHVACHQHLFSGIITFTQKLTLPAVPDAGADCADVDNRQHKEKPQPFGAFDQFTEVMDGFMVAQVAFEGGVAHEQVPAYQPCHGLGFCWLEAKARA